MQTLIKINNYLTDLGAKVAYFLVIIIGICLMLYPAAAFMVFIASFAFYIKDGTPIISLSEAGYVILSGIVSWYLGVGLYHITKKIDDDHID